jgi:hypothetical protein
VAAGLPAVLVIFLPDATELVGQPLPIIAVARHAVVIIQAPANIDLGRVFWQYGCSQPVTVGVGCSLSAPGLGLEAEQE